MSSKHFSSNSANVKLAQKHKPLARAIALALMVAVPVSAWAAPKLELVNQVSLTNSTAVTVQGNYAYTGDGTTLKIFDVSDPAKPTVVGTSAPMPDSYIMEVVIKGNYAYVANARGGLRILDISNPQHPFEVGVYNTNQPNDGNDWTLWGVDVRDNYAYVADMGSGLRIVDISNPAKPVEVGFYDTPSLAHAVKLNGNFAYVVDWSGGLRIVDITNPKSPKEVSFVATRGITYGVAFSNDGKLAYIADYNGLRIVDISNPQSPKDIGFFGTPGIAISVVADGNYVYMNSYSELKVLDVSNPQSPQQVNSYNAPVNNSGYGLGRHKLNNNLLYVPNGNLGLLILSNGEPSSACGGVTNGLVACYPFDGNANDGSGKGNHGTDISNVEYAKGVIGQAASFNGNGSIRVLDSTSIASISEAITTTAWFNVTALDGFLASPIVTRESDSAQDYTFALRDGEYGLIVKNWQKFFEREQSASIATDGKWHFVATAYDTKSGEMKLFVDGKLTTRNINMQQVLGITKIPTSPNSSLFIGFDPLGYPEHFSGMIDDLRIYNRALTEAEIKQLYEPSNTTCTDSNSAQNLISNGDFSQGNTKFDSDYSYSNSGYYAASYWVGDNPVNWNWAAANFADHTTGNGLMFIGNGGDQANQAFWQQKVSVTPNTSYLFSGWAASWGNNNGTDSSPSVLRFLINDAQIGQDVTIPAKTGQWSKFEVNWNSGNSTGATIEIVDVNLASWYNDFALDDLSMVSVSCEATKPANCPETPTIRSKATGNWSDASTWDLGRVPNKDDVVQIEPNTTVTTAFTEVKGLCNFGTLAGTVGNELTIKAVGFLYNTGTLQAANGKDSQCQVQNNPTLYKHPQANGNNVFLETNNLENTGTIVAGRGGNDSTWNCLTDSDSGAWKYYVQSTDGTFRLHQSAKGTWGYQSGETQFGFPTVGGKGGKVEVHADKFTNKGTIKGGKGGYGDSSSGSPGNDWGNGVHGVTIGGPGGEVFISPNDIDNSTNEGTISGGCGGDADIPGCWSTGDIACNANNVNPSRVGNGGNVMVNLANGFGAVQGCPGSISYWDPTTMKTNANTRFEGSDHVEIYGREGWIMDLTGLTEGAVTANKTITIAVGKGGTVDLRGVNAKVFKAAEKVEIFADNLLLDDGVTIESLAETAKVTVSPGKILYRVALSTEQHVTGKAGGTVAMQLTVLNNGPTADTYTLEANAVKGWQVKGLPKTVTIEGLKNQSLPFEVTLSSATGDDGVITLTATSQNDPQTKTVIDIRGETEGTPEVPQLQYTATGKVLAETNMPLPGATVKMGDKTTTTDAHGNWQIDGLTNGNYTATVTKNGYTIPTQNVVVNGENLTFDLGVVYSVYGTIKDEQKRPVGLVTITIGDQQTQTDAIGNWKLDGLPAGESTLIASKDGYKFAPVKFVLGDQEPNKELLVTPASTLVMTAKPSPWQAIRQGANVTYTYTLFNGGVSTATGVTFTETVPNGAKLVTLTPKDGGECDAQTLTCTLPDLTAGATAQVELVLQATDGNSLKNTATVTANEYPADVQTSYKTVKPHLSVTVTDSHDPVVMLTDLHYTATVELSPLAPETTAKDINLVMQLPKGLELKAVTPAAGTCDSSQFPLISCQLPDLSIATPDSISQTAVNVDVTLKDAGLLVLTNEAKVTASNYPAHTVREKTNIFIPDTIKIDMVLVIDTTNSMQPEINGVYAALNQLIKEIPAGQRPTMALIEFKDDVRVKAFTQDTDVMLGAVAKLVAEGGGTCPEASAEALEVALKHLKDGGTIFLATDASPYPEANLENLAALIKSKNMKFNALITGDCSSEGDWNGMTE